MPNNTSGLFMLCLCTSAPLALGALLGAHYTRRRLERGSWLKAILPAKIIQFLEKYQ